MSGANGTGGGGVASGGRLVSWLKDRFLLEPPAPEAGGGVHERFRLFRRLLDRNHQILKLIADMEEKAGGEYLFDRSYIHTTITTLKQALEEVATDLVAIGGRAYLPLGERARAILDEIETLAEGRPSVREDRLIRPLAEVGSAEAWTVGGKNAQLGELASRAALPTPEGFAVTAWAYRRFLAEAGAQSAIEAELEAVNLRSYADLTAAAGRIQERILSAPLPPDLESAIRDEVDALARRTSSRFLAVRSSAVGEDSELSFAGQYRSELNVPLKRAVEAYRRVVAGKFTPGAIYYLHSHSLEEADAPMSVGFVEMLDARAAGVVYTRNPVDAEADVLVVQAVHGLGAPLVGGRLSPDTFVLSRTHRRVVESHLVSQPFRVVATPGGGVHEEAVPEAQREEPAVAVEVLSRLAELALRAEALYGGPRDIEWVLDHRGRLVLLQCRPLRVFKRGQQPATPVVEGAEMLIEEALTASPGAGAGPVVWVETPDRLASVPPGSVIVTPRPLPGLVAVMDRTAAIVTEVGGSASHMATLARERGVPTLVGALGVERLSEGLEVTVDATAGKVYRGRIERLLEARLSETEPLLDEPIFVLLRSVLGRIAPLNLVHPSTPDFQIDSCRTVHDVIRFAHQRALEEMFRTAQASRSTRKIGVRLRTSIPLPVTVVHLERDLVRTARHGKVTPAAVGCPPFEAFWRGIEEEGWPRPPAVDGRGFLSVMTNHMTRNPNAEFMEDSFAILTDDYMMVSLRMGYHFTSVEALATDDPSRNSVRMQYKEGGAAVDRRVRRIRVIDGVLRRLGFESSTAGDFLDAQLGWVTRERLTEVLGLLGRLNIMTKQLDMALASDKIAAWYEGDLTRRLGIQIEEAQ